MIIFRDFKHIFLIVHIYLELIGKFSKYVYVTYLELNPSQMCKGRLQTLTGSWPVVPIGCHCLHMKNLVQLRFHSYYLLKTVYKDCSLVYNFSQTSDSNRSISGTKQPMKISFWSSESLKFSLFNHVWFVILEK